MKPIYNRHVIMVFCLAVIDLINAFILFVAYQIIDGLFVHGNVLYFLRRWLLNCHWIRILNAFSNISSNWLLTFQSSPVDVLVLWFVQGRVSVKEVGNESQVQLGVPSHNICGCDKLPAAQPLCLLQHALCPLDVILLLQRESTWQGWVLALQTQRR